MNVEHFSAYMSVIHYFSSRCVQQLLQQSRVTDFSSGDYLCTWRFVAINLNAVFTKKAPADDVLSHDKP